ncbi:MAG: hypothetical protein HYX53_02110 [Chloroflexi bacterium]|nr:hypothetical protein [Chloroflexota bacterium]
MSPERELRARLREDVTSRFAVTYKVYVRGRLRGAILPIKADPDGARWEALDLEGNSTKWRQRNQARDHLCELPERVKT